MSTLDNALIDALAAMLTSQIPQESKYAACMQIIHYVEGGLLAFQQEGYRVSETAAMKAYNTEMKRSGVEALIMLSQQPAKSG